VANSGNNTIVKLAPDGIGTVFGSSGLNQPVGLAFDSEGNLYAANAGNRTIARFTPGGVGSVFASFVGNQLRPEGLAFDPAGYLWASSFDDITLVTFTSEGAGAPLLAIGISGPKGLAFGSGFNLYVANSGNDTVVKLMPYNVVVSVFASSGVSRPVGLAFDSATDLYVANEGNNTIERFSPDGASSVFADASDGLSSPPVSRLYR